jgi:rubrerythrin
MMDLENHMIVGEDKALDQYHNGTCDVCGHTLNDGECGYCSAQQDKEDQIQQDGD